MIRGAEVRRVIAGGEVIEDYPEDARGPSCLLLGYGDQDRPIHVVCAPRDDYLAIITAYLPDPQEWSGDFQIYLGSLFGVRSCNIIFLPSDHDGFQLVG
jgi:hypothetical protein